MSENSPPLTCAFHPKRETRLRCNKCGRPICLKCAQHTPTGYRCPECIKNQQKIFITTKWYDYLSGSLAAGILSFLGSLLAGAFGFYVVFIAPIVGAIIVAIVRKITKKRRSPRLYQVVAAASFLGSVPILLINIIGSVLIIESLGLGAILPLTWIGLYSTIVTTTVYYQFNH
ncbi:MAG: hypothetical protein DRI56_00545 [Chloroflexota bacterium]|nr:MAG: hypothetical protein B6243_08420 [Anaerolineaceae bacterium 4572_5.2]RLD11638.1 MAG: hypothetical protein DRI56_00545 [Chloroflexota bacterium]